MLRCLAIAVAVLASDRALAQVPPKPPIVKPPTELPRKIELPSGAAFAIEAVTPNALAVRPGKQVACSFEGAKLDEVEEFRVTRGGAVEAGWKFTKALASSSLLSLKLTAPANAAAGAVQLELRRSTSPAKLFQQVALKLRVDLPVTHSIATPKVASKPGGRAIGGSEKIVGAAAPARNELATRLPASKGRDLPRSIELEKVTGIRVDEFRPRQRGALGGTFEIKGSGLEKATGVRLGDLDLELVTRSDTRIVGRFPTGVETLGGGLSIRTEKIPVPLDSAYEVVDAFARFEPKLTLLHAPSPLQGPALRADGRVYDRANYIIAFTVEQVPGTECTMSLDSYVDGFEAGSTIAAGELLRFNELGVNLNGALLAARPRLRVTGGDPALRLSKSFTLELPIEFAPRETVTLEETWPLHEIWSFEQTWGWGQTSGTSDFGAGKVQVGMVNAGGDLAFRIASGPIGTEAVFRSMLSKLKNGWTVESLEWVEECVAPDGQPAKARALTVEPSVANFFEIGVGNEEAGRAPGNFYVPGIPEMFQTMFDRTFRSIPALMRPFGVAANDAFLWRRPMVWMDYDERTEGNRPIYGLESSNWLRSMFIAMKAEATALNDHRVTVRLARAVFKGPPGEEISSLFATTITDERDQIELIPKQVVR